MPSRRSLLKAIPLALLASLFTGSGGGWIPNVQANPSSQSKRAAHILVTADTGSGNAEQFANGKQMAAIHRQRPVDFVILGGDNIYPDGNLAEVEAKFSKPYAALLQAVVPFNAVLGNHDIRTGNGEPRVAYKPSGMKGRWYTIRQGPVEFFMLDTNMNAPWQFQMPWLKKALASSSAPWKVVVGHHPIYSSGLYGNDPGLKAKLSALMRQHGVQLYINGHEHNYERSKPIDGITYLVVGGGGASLRPVIATAQTAKAASVFSFAEIEAGPRQLSVEGWDKNGREIDRAVIASR